MNHAVCLKIFRSCIRFNHYYASHFNQDKKEGIVSYAIPFFASRTCPAG